MSVLKSRPVLRWVVPAVAAATVIGGGAAIGTFAAEAEPSLPPRTAAQLLVDLQTAQLDGLSGTVVQRADLGLPPIAGLLGGTNDLTALVTGTHTLRVWHSGPDKQRIALLDTLGEKNVVRNGRDLWTWDSRRKEASHRLLGTGAGERGAHEGGAPEVPLTPQEAADKALAAVDPSTAVSVGRAATVAGRDAYELVLEPRDKTSLVHQLRVAIDAREHVPLRFEVFATGSDQPAFEVAFTQVDFRRPDADQFSFNPPPGVTVREESAERPAAPTRKPGADARPQVRTVGTGWTTVIEARTGEALPTGAAAGATGGAKDPAGGAIAGGLGSLPAVRGDWGSGRLLTGKLFSVLLTDDGRVLAGAVTPERLYEVARG
ncbi:outer membrane lipoprotein carrier protein LolA [Micromonospora krabiensis]|uniref:Outer membrane lipoprotein-sorting protein n=1 Tax=Micromonospora krabiensis TaxID=307121 RepID=A0A1C3N395_9ACTN|nr:sigma-E factor regulatory protein RseB domain-containing protein [Micromonospora krabiensis]SBV27038.1 Outer membrane lipoprotein-sorting protein [Micromonospora krabiensis]